ncbi:hypothetical protein [Hyphococcus luteus]|uniref:hypothetical protein n=1 Tax=Hyphococcus luteus TaxID=2058213 RepID=UPI0013FE29B2|nr:hypothetical protein [Marinicaulis flavus]
MRYDVGADGVPENIRVIQARNDCFDKEAAIAVAMWRYEVSDRVWTDLETTMTFDQSYR